MNLYEIEKKIKEQLEAFEAAESSEEVESVKLNIHTLKLKLDEKLSNIGRYILNLEAEKNAIAEEIKRLQAKKKAKENHIERLKNYVSGLLKGNKWSDGIVSFSWRKSDQVNILDEIEIPEEFILYERKIKKNDIKKELRGGVAVPGAELIKNNNLQVK